VCPGKLPAIKSKLAVHVLHIHKLHESKKVLWQRFWLDSCTKQVVSARACAYQFLPYNSSGINLFGKRTVQADSCLHSEQINTLFYSVGGQEGGGGCHLGPEAQSLHVTVRNCFLTASCPTTTIHIICLAVGTNQAVFTTLSLHNVSCLSMVLATNVQRSSKGAHGQDPEDGSCLPTKKLPVSNAPLVKALGLVTHKACARCAHLIQSKMQGVATLRRLKHPNC